MALCKTRKYDRIHEKRVPIMDNGVDPAGKAGGLGQMTGPRQTGDTDGNTKERE